MSLFSPERGVKGGGIREWGAEIIHEFPVIIVVLTGPGYCTSALWGSGPGRTAIKYFLQIQFCDKLLKTIRFVDSDKRRSVIDYRFSKENFLQCTHCVCVSVLFCPLRPPPLHPLPFTSEWVGGRVLGLSITHVCNQTPGK